MSRGSAALVFFFSLWQMMQVVRPCGFCLGHEASRADRDVAIHALTVLMRSEVESL